MKHYLLAVDWNGINKADEKDYWKYVRISEAYDGTATGEIATPGWNLYLFATKKRRDAVMSNIIDNKKATYSPHNSHAENMLAIAQAKVKKGE